MYPCHEYAAASQFFSFSKAYELRREDSCAEVAETAGPGIEPVRMVPCNKENGSNQEWVHTKKGRLIHKATNKCLDAVEGADNLVAAPCKAVDSQIWFFDNYFSS